MGSEDESWVKQKGQANTGLNSWECPLSYEDLSQPWYFTEEETEAEKSLVTWWTANILLEKAKVRVRSATGLIVLSTTVHIKWF